MLRWVVKHSFCLNCPRLFELNVALLIYSERIFIWEIHHFILFRWPIFSHLLQSFMDMGVLGFSFHMIWLNGISGVCYPCSLVPTKVLETVILLESPSYINIVKMSIIIAFQSVKIWKRSLTADVIEASMSAAASYNSTVKFNVDLCVCVRKREWERMSVREDIHAWCSLVFEQMIIQLCM